MNACDKIERVITSLLCKCCIFVSWERLLHCIISVVIDTRRVLLFRKVTFSSHQAAWLPTSYLKSYLIIQSQTQIPYANYCKFLTKTKTSNCLGDNLNGGQFKFIQATFLVLELEGFDKVDQHQQWWRLFGGARTSSAIVFPECSEMYTMKISLNGS